MIGFGSSQMPREQEFGREAAAIVRTLRKASGASQWDVIVRVKKVSARRSISISQPKLSLFEAGRRSLSSDDLDVVGEAIEDLIIDNWDGIQKREEVLNALCDWLKFQAHRYMSPHSKINFPASPPEVRQKNARIGRFGKHAADPSRVTKSDVAREIRLLRTALLELRIEEADEELAEMNRKLSLLKKQTEQIKTHDSRDGKD